MRSLGAPLLAVVLIACGGGTTTGGAPDAPPSATDGPAGHPRPARAKLHEGSGLVLDRKGVGPQVCFGGVFLSDPPQCAGVPLVGWDWAAVEGEQTKGESTWGEYRVVGTYDGQRLTLAEPPTPPRYRPQPASSLRPACAEPKGGWARPDPTKMKYGEMDKVNAAAQKMPRFAALWISHLVRPAGEHVDPNSVVLNVTFTGGDLARREAELRALWGGALCVATQKHTEPELAAIRVRAEAMIAGLGLERQLSELDVVGEKIHILVTAVTEEQLAQLREKFGAYLVVSAALRPLP